MYFGIVSAPEQRVNNGVLLEHVHVEDWKLEQQGKQWSRERYWIVFITAPQVCAEQCSQWKQTLEQIKTALGKDASRVRIHLVSRGEGLYTEQLEMLGDGVWLADPLGNFVLRYEFSQMPKLLLKDLKKLLRISRIG